MLNYEQESIALLKHLGLYSRRPGAYIHLMNAVLTQLCLRNGYGRAVLPQNNDFGVDGSRVMPTNFLKDLESLPPHLQLLLVQREDPKTLHWFHDDEVLFIEDGYSWSFLEELQRRQSHDDPEVSKGFRKANSVYLNPDKVFEFMCVTGLAEDTLKVSDDTQFLRNYYHNTRIHTDGSTSWALMSGGVPSKLVKLLPHCADKIYREGDLRIYGAAWQTQPKSTRKHWHVLDWQKEKGFRATDLLDLDIKSCALSVVSHHFGYDAKEIVKRMSKQAFNDGQVPLTGFTRQDVKFIVNSIIHGGYIRPGTSALSKAKLKISHFGYEANEEIVDVLCDYLPPLRHVVGYHKNAKADNNDVCVPVEAKHHFMKMYQRIESDWAMKMLRFASKNDMTVLTFHDGFTVPKSEIELFSAYNSMVLPKYLGVSIDPFVPEENE